MMNDEFVGLQLPTATAHCQLKFGGKDRAVFGFGIFDLGKCAEDGIFCSKSSTPGSRIADRVCCSLLPISFSNKRQALHPRKMADVQRFDGQVVDKGGSGDENVSQFNHQTPATKVLEDFP